MGTIARRQIDPLSEANASRAALRGATLLVLVSIVMAGSPLERGSIATAPATAHREARLVSASELAQADAGARAEEDSGTAATAPAGPLLSPARSPGSLIGPASVGLVVRPPVRVEMLDLPPPRRA